MNEHERQADKAEFGFWVYLMTDLIIFGVLFAVYCASLGAAAAGPAPKQFLTLGGALVETLVLLTSSFTCGLALLSIRRNRARLGITFFAATAILGFVFLSLELREFAALIGRGFGPDHSALLSAFFALVGTHGLHIAAGLLWMIVGIIEIGLRGATAAAVSRLTRLAMFWHFLDLVWIFIFTIVYLLGFTL